MREGSSVNIKYLLLAAISGAVITADQAAKMYILTHFQVGEIFAVWPNVFNITHVHNMGAAFGFLADSHPGFREMFFLAMPPIALLIILIILRGVRETDRVTVSALASIFGGAIGNYIDRLRFRYVIDFLDFTVVIDSARPDQRFVYPSFNIADCAIVIGVAVLLFLEFTRQSDKKDTPSTAGEPAAS